MPRGVYIKTEAHKRKISDKLKGRICSPKTIFKKGYHPPTEFKKGKNHPDWKGGRIRNQQGYFWIYRPKHPFVDCNGYVLEHRLVMEKKLGRPLKPTELVHHKGTKYPMGSHEDRGDNRPENLKLFKNIKAHFKYHRSIRERL